MHSQRKLLALGVTVASVVIPRSTVTDVQEGAAGKGFTLWRCNDPPGEASMSRNS